MILGTEPIKRRRYSAGSYGTDGRWDDGGRLDDEILASVQPMNGRDLQLLPEGLRQRDSIKVYTEAELRTANQHVAKQADELQIDSIWYQVHTVSRQRSIIPHYKAICLRVQESA